LRAVYSLDPHAHAIKPPKHERHAGLSGVIVVEHMIQLHIEKLPEGGYLATSDEVQGLVAQGRTIQETLEIARDVAKKLIEAEPRRVPSSVMPRFKRGIQ
jgi:predicted RNase H-like HicB family nuclease